MITPPIIINQKGDIELRETISDAELELEPIDVANNEYTVFDSRGLVLVPIICDDRIHVRLVESSPPELRPSELEHILRDLFSDLGEERTSIPDHELQQLPLTELVARLDAFQKRPYPRRGLSYYLPWRRNKPSGK
jgi:hypothetical protein